MKILEHKVTQQTRVYVVESDYDEWESAKVQAKEALIHREAKMSQRSVQDVRKTMKISNEQLLEEAKGWCFDIFFDQLMDIYKEEFDSDVEDGYEEFTDLELTNDRYVVKIFYENAPRVVKLPNFKLAKVNIIEPDITEEEQKEVLDKILSQHPTYVSTNQRVKSNDYVIVDIKRRIDYFDDVLKDKVLHITKDNQEINDIEKFINADVGDVIKTTSADKKQNLEFCIKKICYQEKSEPNSNFFKSLKLKTVKNKFDFDCIVHYIAKDKKMLEVNKADIEKLYKYIVNNTKLNFIPTYTIEKEYKWLKDNNLNFTSLYGIEIDKNKDVKELIKEEMIFTAALDEAYQRDILMVEDADLDFHYDMRKVRLYKQVPLLENDSLYQGTNIDDAYNEWLFIDLLIYMVKDPNEPEDDIEDEDDDDSNDEWGYSEEPFKVIDQFESEEKSTYRIELSKEAWEKAIATAKSVLIKKERQRTNKPLDEIKKTYKPTEEELLQEAEDWAENIVCEEFLDTIEYRFESNELNDDGESFDIVTRTKDKFAIDVTYEHNLKVLSLPDFNKLDVKFINPEITDDDIDNQMEKIALKKPTYVATNDVVKENDVVFANVIIKLDRTGKKEVIENKAIEIKDKNSVDYCIDVNKIIGHKIGDIVNVKHQIVDFLDIEIQITDICNKELPRYDAILINKLNLFNVYSIKDLRQFALQMAYREKYLQVNEQAINEIKSFILKNTKINFIPKMQIDSIYSRLEKRNDSYWKMFEIKEDDNEKTCKEKILSTIICDAVINKMHDQGILRAAEDELEIQRDMLWINNDDIQPIVFKDIENWRGNIEEKDVLYELLKYKFIKKINKIMSKKIKVIN